MMLADFTTLIIIAIIAAIANWLKKKAEGGDEDETTWNPSDEQETHPPPRRTQAPPLQTNPQRTQPQPQRPTPAPASTSDWEEELRKMLEGENTSPPPVTRPDPQPVPERHAPPPVVIAPAPVYQAPPPKPVTYVPPTPAQSPRSRRKKELAALQESHAAHSRVERMDDFVGQRLSGASASHQHYYKTTCRYCGGKIEFPTSSAGTRVECPHCGESVLLAILEASDHLVTSVVHRQTTSDAARAAVQLVRGPDTAKQALIASIILGPPRALSMDI